MKPKLLAVMLLAGSSLFAGVRFSVGIGVGAPVPLAVAPVVTYAPPPAPVAAYVAPAPGPGYVWAPGYQVLVGGRYIWHAGYWGLPPYAGGHGIAPRYYGHRR